MKKLRKTLLAALSLTVFVAACADGPMAPEMADVPLAAAFGKKGGGDDPGTQDAGLEILQWINPLSQDITVSKLCSPNNPCDLRIDEIDAHMSIPEEALRESTMITMTAKAGPLVNFEFGPHGTQFRSPINVSVGQERTNARGRNFTAVYWVDSPDNVVEQISAKLLKNKLMFWPSHFSGYAIAM